jgi:hypothetical protein
MGRRNHPDEKAVIILKKGGIRLYSKGRPRPRRPLFSGFIPAAAAGVKSYMAKGMACFVEGM